MSEQSDLEAAAAIPCLGTHGFRPLPGHGVTSSKSLGNPRAYLAHLQSGVTTICPVS